MPALHKPEEIAAFLFAAFRIHGLCTCRHDGNSCGHTVTRFTQLHFA